MPAIRKPVSVLQLSGSFRKDPQRRRVDPPTDGPIGRAPRQKPLTLAEAWNYIVKCAPKGALRDRDRVYLEVAASLFVQFRQSPAEFHPAKLARLEMMLAKMGMNPADASRVSVTKPVQPGDEWE